MASNGYLRTVRVGGFDKQDVLAYVDDLTSKIYTLEAQVNDQNETIERLEKQGGAQKQDFEGKKELEKKVEEAKNKIAELMANTDTMKVRIADYEQQVTEKDAELEKRTVLEVVNLVNGLKMEKQVEYISFSMNVCKELVKLSPKTPIAYLAYKDFVVSPKELKELGISGLDYHYSLLLQKPEFVEEAKTAGITVNVWTANDPIIIQKLIDIKVDYITTDEPVKALELSAK